MEPLLKPAAPVGSLVGTGCQQSTDQLGAAGKAVRPSCVTDAAQPGTHLRLINRAAPVEPSRRHSSVVGEVPHE